MLKLGSGVRIVLVALVALGVAAACSDDSGTPTPDGKTPADAASEGAALDTTPGDLGDLGPAGNATCNGILTCIANDCDITKDSYQVCVSGCRLSGTHAAQKLFDAYTTCADDVVNKACAGDCGGNTPDTCATCLRRECIDPFLTCNNDK